MRNELLEIKQSNGHAVLTMNSGREIYCELITVMNFLVIINSQCDANSILLMRDFQSASAA